MDRELKQATLPLVRDMNCWKAYLAILDHYEKDIIRQFTTNHPTDTLTRLNAQLVIITTLKKFKETIDAYAPS